MEVCHPSHRKRWCEFHLPVRLVWTILAVELSFWREWVMKVTYRHAENLQA